MYFEWRIILSLFGLSIGKNLSELSVQFILN